MNGDNKINIPWYRRNVRFHSGESSGTAVSPGFDFDPRKPKRRKKKKEKTRNRKRERVKERVPQRVPENVRERAPSRVPGRLPVLDPRQLPDAGTDPGTNPYRNPATNPIPLPLPGPMPSPAPNPRRDPGGTPGVNQKQPTPQAPFVPNPGGGFALPYEIPSVIPPPGYTYKAFTPQQQDWVSNFIGNVEMVSKLTAIEAAQLYIFMRDYDYQTNNASTFAKDAQAEFGMVAGTILFTMVVAKSLGELWGKRVTAGFAPMVKLDDEYMQDYFGTKIY